MPRFKQIVYDDVFKFMRDGAVKLILGSSFVDVTPLTLKAGVLEAVTFTSDSLNIGTNKLVSTNTTLDASYNTIHLQATNEVRFTAPDVYLTGRAILSSTLSVNSHSTLVGNLTVGGITEVVDITATGWCKVDGAITVLGVSKCKRVECTSLDVSGTTTLNTLVLSNPILEIGQFTLQINPQLPILETALTSNQQSPLTLLRDTLYEIRTALKAQSIESTSSISGLSVDADNGEFLVLKATGGSTSIGPGEVVIRNVEAYVRTATPSFTFGTGTPTMVTYASLGSNTLQFEAFQMTYDTISNKLALTLPSLTSNVEVDGASWDFKSLSLSLTTAHLSSKTPQLSLTCTSASSQVYTISMNATDRSTTIPGLTNLENAVFSGTVTCTSIDTPSITVEELVVTGSCHELTVSDKFTVVSPQFTKSITTEYVDNKWVISSDTSPLSIVGSTVSVDAPVTLTSALTCKTAATFEAPVTFQSSITGTTINVTSVGASTLSSNSLVVVAGITSDTLNSRSVTSELYTVTGDRINVNTTNIISSETAITLRNSGTNLLTLNNTGSSVFSNNVSAPSCTLTSSLTCQTGIFQQSLSVTSTQASTSPETGAIVILGGAGVRGDLNVRGDTTFYGKITHFGDFNSVTTSSTTLGDNVILLNASPAVTRDSGISVARYQIPNDNGQGDIVANTGNLLGLPSQSGMTSSQVKIGGSTDVSQYWIRIMSGFSANQVRLISEFNVSTGIATLSTPFTSQNPTTGDTYALYGSAYPTLAYSESSGAWQSCYSATPPTSTTVPVTSFAPFKASNVICTSTTINGVAYTPHAASVLTSRNTPMVLGQTTTIITLPTSATYIRISGAVLPTDTSYSPSGYEILLVKASGTTWSQSYTQVGADIATFVINEAGSLQGTVTRTCVFRWILTVVC